MEEDQIIEDQLNENNLKIKNLKVNRNINFGKSLFSISNMVLSYACANNCVNLGLEGNKLLFIPASLLFILHGANFVYFVNKLIKTIDTIKDINELKRVKKRLELYKGLDNDQEVSLRDICKKLNKTKKR